MSTVLFFICPEFSGSPETVESVCEYLERVVPAWKLNCSNRGPRPQVLPDRLEFIRSVLATLKGRSHENPSLTLCNSAMDEGHVSLTFSARVRAFADAAILELWSEEIDSAVSGELLAELGDQSRAWHGTALVRDAGFVDPTIDSKYRKLHPLELKLGDGVLRRNPKYPAYLLPFALQWMHYFSAETSRILDFPNRPGDKRWLWRDEPTQRGGWVVQLTPERLDMRRVDHCIALREAYERFSMGWVPAPL